MVKIILNLMVKIKFTILIYNYREIKLKIFLLTIIYIIKQRHSYIYTYVAYSRPNGWTEWAEIFCGHAWVAGGCYRLKNN